MKKEQAISSVVIEEKINLKPEILEELKKASLSTTGHGLPRIIESKSYFLKITWLIFTLVSIGLCAFMVIKSVNQYLNFEVNTKISVKKRSSNAFPGRFHLQC